mgnify:CR=1 FL=1
MKQIILAFLFIGMITCQASVEVCITDLQSGVKVVNDLKATLDSKDLLKTITYIAMVQPLFEKTKSDCAQITKQDILVYAYNQLNAAQKQCLTDVLSVVFVGYNVYEDFQSKNWSELFQDLSNLTTDVQTAQKDCNGAFRN